MFIHNLLDYKMRKNKNMFSELELNNILTNVDQLLPQFGNFILQFNTIVIENTINVINEADGSLTIEVPKEMPDSVSQTLSQKIRILDRLVMTRTGEIDSLLQKGLVIEDQIKEQNPEFISKIIPKITKFQEVAAKYPY